MLLSIFPEREIVLQVGSFAIRWYGLLWATSFWLVWYLAPKLQKHRGLTLSQEEWTKIIAWGAVGALVGGRVGYALFYEPGFFGEHPAQLFAIWQGGMASHGGFIGAAVMVWLVIRSVPTKSTHIWVDYLRVLDVLVVPVALALALGRLGNWINFEIFGANPVAIGKELVVAGVCYWALRASSLSRSHARQNQAIKAPHRGVRPSGLIGFFGSDPTRGGAKRPITSEAVAGAAENERGGHAVEGAGGLVVAVFLLAYSVLRLFIEPLRDDPWELTFGLTRGQLLTLPLLALGVWLLVWQLKQRRISRQRIADSTQGKNKR